MKIIYTPPQPPEIKYPVEQARNYPEGTIVKYKNNFFKAVAYGAPLLSIPPEWEPITKEEVDEAIGRAQPSPHRREREQR